jgi:hypothetical protein
MAAEDKNNQSSQGSQTGNMSQVTFNKGLFKDSTESAQPQGTYRWALNAINESLEGDSGTLINEIGNYECANLGDEPYAIIGSVYIKEHDFVIFLAPTDPTLRGYGKIVRVTNCKTETLVYSDCLDFRIDKQIQAVQRTRNGCEVNIYFTDNYNDVRNININSLRDYLKEGIPEDAIERASDPTIWDCETMKIWPNYSMPCIHFDSINEGGNLLAGSYQFAVQYLDKDLNSTNWTAITQPVPVYEDQTSNPELRIKGSEARDKTGKSIRLRISNIDNSFAFLRVAVIPNIDGVGTNTGSAYLLDPLPLFNSDDKFIEVTTVRTEDEVTVPIAEIRIPRKTYQKAKTIAQIKNRLVLGNVSENEVDYAKFQRAAQSVQLKYTTRTTSAEDAQKDSVQSGKYYFDYRTYMRDEIYAFAIVWIFNDGTESPAFHVPGRKKDQRTDGTQFIQTGEYHNPNSSEYTNVGFAEHNREWATNGWDSSVIVGSSQYADTRNINTHHYLNNTIDGNGNIERWEVYNTAVREQAYTDAEGEYITKGQMGYYECRTDRYPDSTDCNGVPIYPYSKKVLSTKLIVPPEIAAEQALIDLAFQELEDGVGNGYYEDPNTGKLTPSYVMDKVRHHRMPDTTLEPHQYGDKGITNGKIHEFGNGPFQAGEPKIISLGVEAIGVQPPQEYAHLVQGFRIVRAQQEIKDKTVIDKGLIYYNHIAYKQYHGKELAAGPYFSACNWMQQGNYFNKHITSFACVRGGWTNPKIAEFGRSPDGGLPLLGSDNGQVSIAADNVYNIEYDTNQTVSSGFVASYGIGGGVGDTEDETDFCLNCSQGLTVPVNAPTQFPSKFNAFTNMLVQNNRWAEWVNVYQVYAPGLGFNRPKVVSDYPEFGNGYPSAAWGWSRPANLEDCPAVTSDEGINIGYDTDIEVYPNSNVSYHGPLSKFGKIDGAEYMKVERVLIGYTWNILCNNACCHDDGLEGTHKQSGDTHASTLTGGVSPLNPEPEPITDHNNFNQGQSGIGSRIEGRDDNGTTYIYSRASYQHSVVPYHHIGSGVKSMYDLNGIVEPFGDACINAGGNSNRPEDAWSATTYPIYGYPLSNIRIDDYVKIEAFEKVFMESFGDTPFDNNTAMECMPISFKSKRYTTKDEDGNREQEWIRIPYPGNNDGFNRHFTVSGSRVNNDWGPVNRFQCPLDSSFSLNNCDRLEDHVSGEFCEANSDTGKRGRITAYYVALKKNAYNAYGNIASLVYNPTHNCMIAVDKGNPYLSVNSGQLFGGDSFVSRFAFKHTQYNARCGKHIVGAETYPYGAAGGGEAFTKCTKKDTFYPGIIQSEAIFDPLTSIGGGAGIGSPWSDTTNIIYEQGSEGIDPNYGGMQKRHGIFNHITWYWTESYINTELRLGTQERGDWFYPYHFEAGASYGTLSFVDEPGYFRTAHSGAPYDPDATEGETEMPQSFRMNPDYNKINRENVYLSVPIQYDFCKDCQETHPYRIAYSEQSFQEEQQDNFKYFLTENYRDIPANRGVVWNMFQYRNSLFVHTEESLWRVEPSRNLMQTDTSNLYIGTGDFFSEEIQEIVEGDTGFLGSTSQWALSINSLGVTWVDEKQRKIFVLDQSPKDISAMGIKNWTQNNMEIQIAQQYEDIYGTPFPLIDNPANPAGAGYLSAYDGRHHRLMFTKRDYLLRAPFDTKDRRDPYYQVLRLGTESGLWELHGAGEDCQCEPDPALQILSPSTYNVTTAVDSEGNDICRHTYTIEETQIIGDDTDIWVFYDMTSMSPDVATAANAAMLQYLEDQSVAGGSLEAWNGKDFHVPMKGFAEEYWVRYMELPMGGTFAQPSVETTASFTPKLPSDYGESFGTYISPGAVCIILQDESVSRYHTNVSTPHAAPTALYRDDFQAFASSHQIYTSGGREFKAFVYPVPSNSATSGITQGNRQFIKHVFAAIEGPNTVGAFLDPTTGQPDLPGNSAQIGVQTSEVVDLSHLVTANSYNSTNLQGYLGPALRDYGVSAKYDKRDASTFLNGTFINDIATFLTGSIETITTDYQIDRPCVYNLLGSGNVCASCEEEDEMVEVPLNDGSVWQGKLSEIFECKGWTISYSMMSGSWVSWHSYIPNYYMSSKDYFMSGINRLRTTSDRYIWRHSISKDHDNYQKYYGCIYPHAIDMLTTDSPVSTTVYENLHFITDVSHYNPTTGQYVDDRYITFDSGYMYNSYQITDMMQFVVKDINVSNMSRESVIENYNSCLLDRKERVWGLNGFRDLAVDRTIPNPPSLFTSSWNELAQDYYIDKKINPIAVDQTKPWFEQARMRDRYLGVRLFFSNLANPGKHKLVTNFLYGVTNISPR